MANFQFSIEGVDDYMKRVTKRAEAIQGRAFQILMRRIIIGGSSGAPAPVKTGFLLSEMRMELGGSIGGERFIRPEGYKNPGVRGQKIQQANAIGRRMKAGDTVAVEFQAEYTGWVHDGTSRSRANPFLRRHLRQFGAIVKQALAEAASG